MKTDLYRLRRIVEMGNQLLEVVEEEGITAETLAANFKQQWLVATPLFNIGEQVNCLSAEFVQDYPDQPWSSVAGLRHRLAHNYEGTNWTMIGSVLSDDLAPFTKRVEEIVSEKEQVGTSREWH
ncbi:MULTISPECIES: DUF86 domain-containing protein [unclassified Adlercreutzia]|uniref:HepT-like ribonuclease domain-containing protein n=1 Tax=unclassified Adlercreutzia TaxID=2636013 RepID=UPI0013EB32BC|nr:MULTISPECIES: HepT-like ribonuclease domain-containing protein [unclassified Adlercreutzia]